MKLRTYFRYCLFSFMTIIDIIKLLCIIAVEKKKSYIGFKIRSFKKSFQKSEPTKNGSFLTSESDSDWFCVIVQLVPHIFIVPQESDQNLENFGTKITTKKNTLFIFNHHNCSYTSVE
jgi:hypothetical protein